MSNPIADPGHGHSPAAWTTVVIMLIGIAAGTLFYALDIPVGVYASAGVLVVGLIVGFAMSKAGFGVNGTKYAAKEH